MCLCVCVCVCVCVCACVCACHCVYAHVRVCARVCSPNYNHSTRNMTQLPAKFILQHIDDDIIPQDLSTAPPIHNHLHHDYTTQSYSTVAYSCNYQEISINQPKNATANQHTDANSISPATDHDIPETNPTVSYQEDTWVPCACKRHSNKTSANDDALCDVTGVWEQCKPGRKDVRSPSARETSVETNTPDIPNVYRRET